MRVIENKKAIEIQELDRFGPSARRNTLLLWSVGLYWPSYDLACVLRGSLPTLYSLGGMVISQLYLGDNQKVITDYMNHGIERILTDLVVSSGYLPGVLRGTPSSAVLRKASSCGLDHPWWHNPCSLSWVSGVVPPQLVPKPLVSIVQRRLELVQAGVNKAEQSDSWSDHPNE